MSATRRNILALMGLTAAGAAAAEARDVAEQPMGDRLPSIALRGPETQERFASMLEALAKSIRKGDCACLAVTTRCDVTHGQWIEHEVNLKLEILG